MIGTRHFQVLACEISLETTCPEIAARLEYVTAGAVQEYPVSRRVAYGIDRAGEEYLLREDGDACYRSDCADRVVIELFRRMHGVVYGQMRGRLRLHAGCAEYQGRAFLAVGPKGAGKSTLMARLVFEGFSVSGDEMVFVLGREVTALPRRFHLKPPAIGLLPQVAALADRLPFVLGDDGRKIIAFEPTDAGIPWIIRSAAPAAVFFLVPNHGGATIVRPCPKLDMIRALMSQSTIDADDAGTWIRAVGALVRATDCYTLHLGDLGTAARVMRETLGTAPARRRQAGAHEQEESWQSMRTSPSCWRA